jgi:hypothetical protein
MTSSGRNELSRHYDVIIHATPPFYPRGPRPAGTKATSPRTSRRGAYCRARCWVRATAYRSHWRSVTTTRRGPVASGRKAGTTRRSDGCAIPRRSSSYPDSGDITAAEIPPTSTTMASLSDLRNANAGGWPCSYWARDVGHSPGTSRWTWRPRHQGKGDGAAGSRGGGAEGTISRSGGRGRGRLHGQGKVEADVRAEDPKTTISRDDG